VSNVSAGDKNTLTVKPGIPTPSVTGHGAVSYVEKPRAHAGKPTMTTSIPSSVTTLERSKKIIFSRQI